MASTSRPAISSSSSRGRHNNAARIIAQTTVDAKNAAEFEEQGSSFDYTQSVLQTQDIHSIAESQRNSDKVGAYLQHIKKAKLIQPFGCLIAIDEKSFKIMAYSENAPEMLTMVSHSVPTLGERPTLGIGADMRTIFTSASSAALQKALGYNEVSLLNPILVHCKTSGKPFYAIVHRVIGCLIFDFEPVQQSELPISTTASGALQSYKLAAKAIARLQSLPGGSMARLCETLMEEVFLLTGYDRVMVYRFHEDDHGEVYREITKPGMEPYLGLHYPATDIPQAARFLFIKNKVRMICDCRAKSVEIHQDPTLPFDITFCGSTLRAAHSCHLRYMTNMNSIASLAMSVVVNEEEDDDNLEPGRSQPQSQQQQQKPWQQKRKTLWGLVVCHNESPRFLPFPLRYACQFLMQVFSVHVSKELESENQIREKNILRTQTLLCDMLLREPAPLAIITQSPNIMDLVKCDGAALLYDNKIWRLGLTPTKEQIRSIAHWLAEHHMAATALSTDSLHDAGYPGAQALGDVVSGMAAAWVTTKDILFWFRSNAAAEIRWAGAKHDPDDKDDGTKMHPRSSFKAFLHVTKMRSLPWKDYEMDAIHSLQLILRGTFTNRRTSVNESPPSQGANKPERILELQTVTNEMVRLIETANAPILAADGNGLINGWNPKIAQLTGLSAGDAMGKHLLELVEESSMEVVRKMLFSAMQGQEEQKVQFLMKTHGARREAGPVVLVVNACASRNMNGQIAGACFVAQDMTDHKLVMDKFIRIQGDYKAIVHNPSPLIPPIFSADEFGWCSEWNTAMAKLSGWPREQIIDKLLLGEVFGVHNNACCRLKNQEAYVKLCIIINNAMTGQGTDKTDFDFVNRDGEHVQCLLSVSKKVDSEGADTGMFFFLHTASQELQQVLQVQHRSDKSALKRLKALAYIRNEIRTPLSGVSYAHKRLEATDLNDEQKMILNSGAKCHLQLNRVLSDIDLENIMDCCQELEVAEFVLRDVVIAAVSQVMITSSSRGIRIIMPESFPTEILYGDNLRLQQIIADFLVVSVKYSPSGGQVEITTSINKDRLGECIHLVHLELSMTHIDSGVPEELLSQMFGNHDELPVSEEGISLVVCRKLIKLMNGDVHYLRKEGKSSFVISLEFASATTKAKALALRISENSARG